MKNILLWVVNAWQVIWMLIIAIGIDCNITNHVVGFFWDSLVNTQHPGHQILIMFLDFVSILSGESVHGKADSEGNFVCAWVVYNVEFFRSNKVQELVFRVVHCGKNGISFCFKGTNVILTSLWVVLILGNCQCLL